MSHEAVQVEEGGGVVRVEMSRWPLMLSTVLPLFLITSMMIGAEIRGHESAGQEMSPDELLTVITSEPIIILFAGLLLLSPLIILILHRWFGLETVIAGLVIYRHRHSSFLR